MHSSRATATGAIRQHDTNSHVLSSDRSGAKGYCSGGSSGREAYRTLLVVTNRRIQNQARLGENATKSFTCVRS